ncbi:ROK family protein [Microlunatus parietis]|uniref:Glucokinase n=1 Tax=Microlunatus parietis TaxID=682979 RepID=A0A7Y9L8E6_9ACTN|nr:ROK family protein [Microlunatus parietis]NYE70694.1 glucokinase [Microlunatus parietis]
MTDGRRGIVVGLDVGGTKIIGALFEPGTWRVLERVGAATPGSPGAADPGLVATAAVARELAARAAAADQRVRSVGAGFPEYVAAGRLTSREVIGPSAAPDHVLATEFEPETMITIDSDVRLGAMAEARLGAGRGIGSFLYVSWGTGLSSTLVIEGRAWAGAHGEAIALGEFPIPAGIADGSPVSLEAFASGAAIAHRYASAGASPADGARGVLSRAETGDPVADAVLGSAARALGSVLAAAVRLVDPAAVIFGGGLGSVTELTGRVITEARSRLPSRSACRWLPAELGPDSGLFGAAILAAEAVSGSAARPAWATGPGSTTGSRGSPSP